MSTNPDTDPEQFQEDALSLVQGGSHGRRKAERIFRGLLVDSLNLPTTRVGPDGDMAVNMGMVKDKFRNPDWREEETWAERNIGTKRPGLAGAARGVGVESDSVTRAFDDMEQRATIDATIVESASPVEVDPEIVQSLRSRAPILDEITTIAQAGFKVQYNIVSARSNPLGMLSESEAVDLSSNTPQDFTLSTETKDMERYVDLVEISDFSQRAESTLDYMDLTATTMGQRMIEAALFKSRQFYYGDPSVGSGTNDIEDGDAYQGMTVLANNANTSYTIDKSSTSSGFLEDIKSELTSVVEDTGLTYDAARIAVSPTMFDALENEANAVVRLDSYDGNLEYGGRRIQIKGVPVMEDPNIRNYSSLSSGTTNGGDNGDVFIWDSRNLQFRQLAPMSSVPLGKVGLADRAAIFEYGRLISKSQGEHIRVLQQYDV